MELEKPNKLVTIEMLKNSENGIDVIFSEYGHRHTVRDVHPNVVRCAIGENDMEYLLNTSHFEPFCKVKRSVIADFMKNRVS